MKIHPRFLLPAVLTLIVGLMMGMSACGRVESTTKPASLLPLPPIEQMGALHNEFLTETFRKLDDEANGESAKFSAQATEKQKFEAAFTTANEMLARYGLPLLTREQTWQIIEEGRRRMEEMIAAGDQPDDYIREVFKDDVSGLKDGTSSYDFFLRYFLERQETFQEGLGARKAYQRVCDLLGAPVPGSDLAVFCDVLVYSDEFWLDHYGPESFGFGSAAKGWKKFLKIICVAASDAVGGMLSGAGYGAVGGPAGAVGGAVVGGVVGGLASYGAASALDE